MALLTLLQIGCATQHQVMQMVEQEVGPLRQEIASEFAKRKAAEQRMERMEQDLREVWGSMYCKEEVRNFLRQCEANAKAGAAGAETCPERKMKDVLTFMTTQRHVVLYMKEGQTLASIPDWRKGMLRELTGQKLLLTTRFLVLAHPAVEETTNAAANTAAERRAKLVTDLMLGTYKIPPDRVLGPWLFPYRITGKEIAAHLSRDDDKPKRGEPVNLQMGIWVFRVDC